MRYRISDIDQTWAFWTDSITNIVNYAADLKSQGREAYWGWTVVTDTHMSSFYTLRDFIDSLK